jgi:hypothetical protein
MNKPRFQWADPLLLDARGARRSAFLLPGKAFAHTTWRA